MLTSIYASQLLCYCHITDTVVMLPPHNLFSRKSKAANTILATSPIERQLFYNNIVASTIYLTTATFNS